MSNKCKNGYWISPTKKAYFMHFNEDTVTHDHLISLEYPELASPHQIPLEFGNFGPTSIKIAEASCVMIILNLVL